MRGMVICGNININIARGGETLLAFSNAIATAGHFATHARNA